MKENLIIGSHVSFNNGTQLVGAVNEALKYNSTAFMFYTGAPQNTKRGEINGELTLTAYNIMKENNIALENVVVHAPYIVNLGNLENYDFSVNFLIQEVNRIDKLGIKYMVLHPGANVSYTKEESINSIIKGLNEIISSTQNVIICLETMAGKGTEVGSTLEEIKALVNGINNKDRIGVCLDTCHLFDSGVDLTNFDNYLDNFDKEIGLNYIKVIHINDSKNTISSHKDRHENIGFGNIGFDTLIDIIYHDKLKSIPKILETPYVTKNNDSKEKVYPPYKEEIIMIRNKIFNPNLINDIRSSN